MAVVLGQDREPPPRGHPAVPQEDPKDWLGLTSSACHAPLQPHSPHKARSGPGLEMLGHKAEPLKEPGFVPKWGSPPSRADNGRDKAWQ